ncbi:MAG: 50S ribosome-binding GTPase, partial [Lautropia sp.]|nr:50S ribosome-binding GTPase [Lautropia sp.]
QGVFSGQIDVLADQLLHLRMLVEATLDFPEEEIEFLERADAAGQLDAIDATLRELFATARSGARLRQGLNVVLTGAPNVGKSSLLNALAGAEVAIVTPIAGTTRDRVIEQISIEGVPINLIDTAGLRETDDVVERIGIERTWAEIGKADVVVHLRAVQAPQAFQGDVAASCTGSPTGSAAVTDGLGSLQPDSASPGIPAAGPAASLVHNAAPAALAEQVLEAAIEARVPASAHRLTVINKIDLLGQGGVLPAEAGDMAGRAHPLSEAPARGELPGQADAPVSGLDVTRQSPVPSRTAAILGAEGRTEAAGTSDHLYLSARTGEGVEAFRRKLLDIAGFQPGAEGVFIARERHLEALKEALAHLDNARTHVAHGDQSLDLFAEELRLAHSALGRITGAVSADELLGVIFSRFCIGK